MNKNNICIAMIGDFQVNQLVLYLCFYKRRNKMQSTSTLPQHKITSISHK